MTALTRHHLRIARANRLANHRLHAACGALSHDEWMAPRVGFFPSIAATLNHVLIVDWYYLDAIEEGGRGVALFADRMPYADRQGLADAQRDADLRLIAFCERLDATGDEAALTKTVPLDRGSAGIKADRVDLMLSHAFMHATHHRGQAHAMLSGTSVPPPQLDEFIMLTDAPYRIDDLVATGMTEADLA